MGAVITKIGLKKIKRATIENPLQIEKFAIGDGQGNPIIPNEDMKSLVNEKYRNFINDKYENNNNIVFESILRANAPIKEGFYIRELGLFDKEGDLIVITDTPLQYRPATKEGNIISEILFNISVEVNNVESLEININEQVVATANQFERLADKVAELLNMSKNFYKMFIGVGMTQFNEINPLMNNELIKWEWCEGQTLVVSEYPELYSVLGNRWGGINNVDFKLPDTRNRVVRNQGLNMDWGYQEDALQNVVGDLGRMPRWPTGNPYFMGDSPFYRKEIDVYSSNLGPGYSGADHICFDLSKSNARTADETRVKSLSGRTFMITKVLV